jgi:hypothetical protein
MTYLFQSVDFRQSPRCILRLSRGHGVAAGIIFGFALGLVRRRFMHRRWVFSCVLAVLSWSFSVLGQASEPLAAQSSISQPPAGHDGCSAYLTIAPLDQNVLKLLGTPIVPANEGLAASSGFQQLRAWDLPSKGYSLERAPESG